MARDEDAGALDELLAARDPWPAIDDLAARWHDRLVDACARRLEHADDEGRKRILWLLARVGGPAVHAALLARLPHAQGDERAQIFRTLTSASVVTPTAEIARAFADAPAEATAAAGLSRDPTLIAPLRARLDGAHPSWQAALSLALAGRREHADAIVACVPARRDLDAVGFVVALETMAEPSVVPALRALITGPDAPVPWDLHHALFRLTGREPLVALTSDRAKFAEAWRGYDLGAPPRPHLEGVELEPGGMRATFALVDGAGAIRIDYDPPSLGSSWPRWALSLWASGQALYGIGSRCDTCETTLRATGTDPAIAASVATDLRARLRDLAALDADTVAALTPCLARLRTGHYLAAMVELEVERVTTAERSWLTRRVLHRGEDAPTTISADDHAWLGAEHFQVRDPALTPIPTYGLLLPTQPLTALDEATIAAHAAEILAGTHPCALAMTWLEGKHVRGDAPERFLISAVLDGHHKLAAYARLGRPARLVLVSRLEDSWGPPGDRARWLREAIEALAAPTTR